MSAQGPAFEAAEEGEAAEDGEAAEESARSEKGAALKRCCANLYESDLAKALLGESFHPGGLALTERLGALLGLGPASRVLDAASGAGASALRLGERFGCEVTGVDYGERNVERANRAAAGAQLSARVRFERADVERLPFPDRSFDAIVCECALCTFPDKPAAVRELARVLRDGGRLGVTDVTCEGTLPEELHGLLAWVACIGDARPLAAYVAELAAAGFSIETAERHDAALLETVRQIRGRLFGAELVAALGNAAMPGMDLEAAGRMARAASRAIERGALGYALILAAKPPA